MRNFCPNREPGWRGARSEHNKTVVRAGFGMYNDLQDALGYRTDQNAPFNPTYSLPNVPVSSFPLTRLRRFPSTAKLVPGGVQPDLQTPTLISWSFRIATGTDRQYRVDRRLRRIARLSRDSGNRRQRAVSRDLSRGAVSGDLSEQLPAPASRARRFPPGLTTFRPRPSPIPRSPIPGPISRKPTAHTMRCRWT